MTAANMVKKVFILPIDAPDREVQAMIEAAHGHIRMEQSVCTATQQSEHKETGCIMYTFYYDKVDSSLDRYQGLLQSCDCGKLGT